MEANAQIMRRQWSDFVQHVEHSYGSTSSSSFSEMQPFRGNPLGNLDQRSNRNGRTHLQASLRQSLWNRLFLSKLIFCWSSATLVLMLMVWHSAPSVRHVSNMAHLRWREEFYDQHSSLRSNHLFDNLLSSFSSGSQKNDRRPLSSRVGSYFIHSEDPSSSSSFTVPSSVHQSPYQHYRLKQQQETERLQGQKRLKSKTYSTAESIDVNKTGDGTASNNDSSDPTINGWTPGVYPNPMNNPIRCAIAYLPQFMNHPPPDDSSMNNGEMVSPLQLSTEQERQQQREHPLRLCDPDWILGGMYLEHVAFAMSNFSDVFGEHQYQKAQQTVHGSAELSTGISRVKDRRSTNEVPWVDLAIAMARKMDLQSVLHDGTFQYFGYEDDDDMVNDAAQVFARALHNSWWSTNFISSETDDSSDKTNLDRIEEDGGWVESEHGILLFLSVQDRVCFISTGAAVASTLPWWRLDHIVTAMKPALRQHEYGNAVLMAIDSLSAMLDAGPPSLSDRLHDFCSRFGVVILFATFTFVFGAWGEHRDRRKRFQFAEERSQFKGAIDREKARLLQQGYKTKQCPICLENFCTDKTSLVKMASEELASDVDNRVEEDDFSAKSRPNKERPALQKNYSSFMGLGGSQHGGKFHRADSYGIPLLGADGKRIKLLRCGHIFCESCWKSWVHSGCGNPCNCPVCRQDVGKAPRQSISCSGASAAISPRSADISVESTTQASTSSNEEDTPRAQQSPLIWSSTHPSYDSVSETRLSTSNTNTDNSSTGALPRNNSNCNHLNERQPLLS